MSAGARTFGLHETLAEPQVLPPPPLRHALFIALAALAAILHFGTASWTEIHNGAEGFYAASAKEMLSAGNRLAPRANGVALSAEPPLFHWLQSGVYTLLSPNATAARLPVAAAFVASVALTFLIGERLGGYWRGFMAGLIYLSSCGSYIWGRMVTPEPLLATCVAAALLCAVAGYQRKRHRRFWFAGLWASAAAAYLAAGALALLLLAAIIALSALGFREARQRFSALFHWSGILAFVTILVPAMAALRTAVPAMRFGGVWLWPFATSDIGEQLSGLNALEFTAAHLVWWFPALVLVLPAVVIGWRKIIRPGEFGFVDTLPICWTAAGLVLLLLARPLEHRSIAIWPGFALFCAWAWERAPARLRLPGIGLVGIGGTAAAFAISGGQLVLPGIAAAAFDRAQPTVLMLSAVALAIVCCAAAYLNRNQRDRLTMLPLLLGMVPIGLGAAESLARNSPSVSFARAAHYLATRVADGGEVLFEGPSEAGSSLAFYLERGFSVVSQIQKPAPTSVPVRQLSEDEAMSRMAEQRPIYLIIHKDRVPHWQRRLTERFHIYHQVSTCGSYAVVGNHH